jgi:hypothetical protein
VCYGRAVKFKFATEILKYFVFIITDQISVDITAWQLINQTIPSYQLHKLQRIQNAAVRLIFRESKFCHITPLLRLLHWLPVKQIIQFKLLLLTFRAIHGSFPQYIMVLITVKQPTRYCLRSQNSITVMRPKGKFLATLGDRSFSAAAPKVWNSLPAEIRNIRCRPINVFKSSIKTFLFNQHFLH